MRSLRKENRVAKQAILAYLLVTAELTVGLPISHPKPSRAGPQLEKDEFPGLSRAKLLLFKTASPLYESLAESGETPSPCLTWTVTVTPSRDRMVAHKCTQKFYQFFPARIFTPFRRRFR